MSNKIIFIQEGEENPCLGCTNDCKYPCEAKQKWVLGGGIKGPKKITNAPRLWREWRKVYLPRYGVYLTIDLIWQNLAFGYAIVN